MDVSKDDVLGSDRAKHAAQGCLILKSELFQIIPTGVHPKIATWPLHQQCVHLGKQGPVEPGCSLKISE